MNIYDAETIKKQVKLTQYFQDQGVPLSSGGTRAVAIWRGGKNPSVSVDDAKGVWNDHKTGKGGTLIDAYMAIEGGTVSEAVHVLGDRYHITPIRVTRPAPKVTRGEHLIGQGYKCTVTYTYTDADGNALYYVDRYERATEDGKTEKTFVQRSPTAENLNGVKRVLYNLPALRKADRVFIVEGEKDVETMRRMNLTATTNSGGGKFWEDDFNAEFADKDVVILPDNDEVGETHATSIAAQIVRLARSVKIVKISELPKGDVTDFIEKEGGTIGALLEKVDATIPLGATDEADVLRARALNAEPFMNYTEGEPRIVGTGKQQREVRTFIPRRVDEVCDDLRERALGFPKKLGNLLFDFTRNADPAKREIMPLPTWQELKAWTNGITGHQSDFKDGGTFVSWPELFARLSQTSHKYNGIARAPWFPHRDDVFPIYPILPPADPEHRRFWEYVSRFNHAMSADKQLLAGFMIAPLFYDSGAPRPAWCIDTVDAQGSGKSTVVKMCAALYGESPIGLDLKSLNNDLNQVKKRILSSEGRAKRIALFDNITESFKGANLADFVTESAITGMAPYGRGEETRLNDITWVCTVNGGSVDTDMATRTYKIKIKKPEKYAPRWERETLAFIQKHRLQILADAIDMMSHAPERIRPGSRFPLFDATVLSAVCATDAEFEAVCALIHERANESNEDVMRAQEINETILRYMAQWDTRFYPEGSRPPEPGYAWIISTTDMDTILRSSKGALRGLTSKGLRRLITGGNAPQFDKDFQRICQGEMRKLTAQARGFCFFPSTVIPRKGTIPAQLVQIMNSLPVVVCQEDIKL